MGSLQPTIYSNLTGWDLGPTRLGLIHKGLKPIDNLTREVTQAFASMENSSNLPEHTISQAVVAACATMVVWASVKQGMRSSLLVGGISAGSFIALTGVALSREASYENMKWTRWIEVRVLELSNPGSWLLLAGASVGLSHYLALTTLGIAAAQHLVETSGMKLAVPSSLDQACYTFEGVDLGQAHLTASWQRQVLKLMKSEPTHNLSQLFADCYGKFCLAAIPLTLDGLLRHCLQQHHAGVIGVNTADWDRIENSINPDLIVTKEESYPQLTTEPNIAPPTRLHNPPTLFAQIFHTGPLSSENTQWGMLAITASSIALSMLISRNGFKAAGIGLTSFSFTFISPLATSGIAHDPLLRLDTQEAALLSLALLVSTIYSKRKMSFASIAFCGATSGNFLMHLARANLDDPSDFTPQFQEWHFYDLLHGISSLTADDPLVLEMLPHLTEKLRGEQKNPQAAFVLESLHTLITRDGISSYTSFFLSHILAAIQYQPDYYYGNDMPAVSSQIQRYEARKIQEAIAQYQTGLFSHVTGSKGSPTSLYGVWEYDDTGKFVPQDGLSPDDLFDALLQHVSALQPATTALERFLDTGLETLVVDGQILAALQPLLNLRKQQQRDLQLGVIEALLDNEDQNDSRVQRVRAFLDRAGKDRWFDESYTTSEYSAKHFIKCFFSQPLKNRSLNATYCDNRALSFAPFFVLEEDHGKLELRQSEQHPITLELLDQLVGLYRMCGTYQWQHVRARQDARQLSMDIAKAAYHHDHDFRLDEQLRMFFVREDVQSFHDYVIANPDEGY